MVSMELRQIAGVLEEQALGRGPGGLRAAELVEHGEAVAMLQHAPALDRDGRRRRDVEGRNPAALVAAGRPRSAVSSDRLLQRPVPGDQAAVELEIVLGHAPGREALLEDCRRMRARSRLCRRRAAAAAWSSLSTMKPVTPSSITSGTEPLAKGDDRRAAGHGLDHHQPERLPPGDRETAGRRHCPGTRSSGPRRSRRGTRHAAGSAAARSARAK